MKPKKVLLIAKVATGGVAVVLERLAKKMDKSRFEPIVLFDTNIDSNSKINLQKSCIRTIDRRIDRRRNKFCTIFKKQTLFNGQRNISSRVKKCFGTKISEISLFFKAFMQFILHDIPRIKYFIRIIRKFNIDLVHTHNDINYAKAEIIAARISNIPCISHNHTFSVLSSFDKIFIPFVSSFIFISNEIAKYHIANGKKKSKWRIIHNGVEIKDYKKSYESHSVRKKFKINAEDILIGIIGRIDWWKGHGIFIEAIAEVSKIVPTIKGLIIGDVSKHSPEINKPYFESLLIKAEKLNMQEKIIFGGFRSDIPRIIAAMDIIVHASTAPEPFGLVVIEGMAAGKPVIATAAGGILDIIDDGINGFLIPPKSSKAMADKILQVITNQKLLKEISLAARRKVVERFSIMNHVSAVQMLYDEMLRKASPKRRCLCFQSQMPGHR